MDLGHIILKEIIVPSAIINEQLRLVDLWEISAINIRVLISLRILAKQLLFLLGVGQWDRDAIVISVTVQDRLLEAFLVIRFLIIVFPVFLRFRLRVVQLSLH